MQRKGIVLSAVPFNVCVKKWKVFGVFSNEKDIMAQFY